MRVLIEAKRELRDRATHALVEAEGDGSRARQRLGISPTRQRVLHREVAVVLDGASSALVAVATRPAVAPLRALVLRWDGYHLTVPVNPVGRKVAQLSRAKSEPSAPDEHEPTFYVIRVFESVGSFEKFVKERVAYGVLATMPNHE